MRTLIYKRTHKGDPDESGFFGIEDCMGRVRKANFEAVIGIGGIGDEPRSHGIGGKLNWIGIGAQKSSLMGGRGPLIRFNNFVLFEERGEDFQTIAPHLAQHMYSRKARVLTRFNKAEQAEIEHILAIAHGQPASRGTPPQKVNQRCPKCCRKRRTCQHGAA